MRVICDAPGQTCNRLWTYVTSVARCVAEHRRMVIIFYDWTIEDFPNLLGCPFIYFPLWHKWYLERGNGWNNYKGLTWKVTHSKTWDKIFSALGFTKGWDTMNDTRYLAQTKKELQHIFRPRQDITDRAEQMMAEIRRDNDLVVGIHIRHGDYKTFYDGRYYYTLEEYTRTNALPSSSVRTSSSLSTSSRVAAASALARNRRATSSTCTPYRSATSSWVPGAPTADGHRSSARCRCASSSRRTSNFQTRTSASLPTSTTSPAVRARRTTGFQNKSTPNPK